jgi:hypothetical protein
MLVCRNFSPRSVIVAVVLLASSNSCFVIESTSPSTVNKPTYTCFPICLVSIDMFVDFDMSIYYTYIYYIYIILYRERERYKNIYIYHVCVHTPLFVIISPMLLVISHLFWICEAAGRQAHQEWSHPRRFQIQVVVPLFCWLKMFENNWNTFHFRNSQWIVSKPSFEMNCANVHRTSATVDGIPTPNLLDSGVTQTHESLLILRYTEYGNQVTLESPSCQYLEYEGRIPGWWDPHPIIAARHRIPCPGEDTSLCPWSAPSCPVAKLCSGRSPCRECTTPQHVDGEMGPHLHTSQETIAHRRVWSCGKMFITNPFWWILNLFSYRGASNLGFTLPCIQEVSKQGLRLYG